MPKILIIRFSSIGDIVLTTPVLRCLRQQLPEAEIHYLTKQGYVSLLSANPNVDRIISFSGDMAATLLELKQERYDYVIDLHHNLRSWRIKRKLGVTSYSFDKINLAKWWMVRTKQNRMPQIHIVDRYMAALKPLGLANDGKGLDHYIPENTPDPIPALPEQFRNGYIALVLGAQHATKKLPIEKWQELISEEGKNSEKRHFVLIGGPEDKAEGDLIASQHTTVFNACGQFSMQQSARLIQASQMVVAHDTGMMHIAAALQKKVISIWGNTIPEFGMYPYFGDHLSLETQRATGRVIEVTHLRCRPCSKIGFSACPKGHFSCMRGQDMQVVSKALETD